MRWVARLTTFGFGIIGAVNVLILNVIISSYRTVERIAGADPNSHGWVGLGAFGIAVIGSILALFWPRVGGALLIVAGLIFIYVAHWWALLASPQLILGGLIPFVLIRSMEQLEERRGQSLRPATTG